MKLRNAWKRKWMKFFMVKTSKPLTYSFFEQPALELAQALLGKLIIKKTAEGLTAGWIVETEAYMGSDDRAAHSYGNRRTPRTEVMFGPPGYAYIYEMHTHSLMNVVCGKLNQPHAVLIRAIEPHTGIQLMQQRRSKITREVDLANGPGKLTKAMRINKTDYGRPLFELSSAASTSLSSDALTSAEQPLFIAEGKAEGIAKGIQSEYISSGPRIGINNSGEAKDYPWRFWITGNKYVSR